MNSYTQEIEQLVDHQKDKLTDISKKIWESPELPLEEHQSSAVLKKYLKKNGFTITDNVSGIETAFTAQWGDGYPTIGLLAEYDALPELSQKPQTTKEPVISGGPGHGCGHNLLGTAVVGSAVAIKEIMQENKLQGSVIVFGCPAEEIMYGKIKMAEKGIFNQTDACLTWHPMFTNKVSEFSFAAMNSIKFSFDGISSHAAAAPELGRSALDAVELMNVGANYLREHIISQARIHYIITNGGSRPNIVPNKAESWYYVRAPYKKQVNEIVKRLTKIAEGAALMTETKASHEVLSICTNTKLNDELNNVLFESMKNINPPKWTEEEKKFGTEIQNTIDKESRSDHLEEYGLLELENHLFHDDISNLNHNIRHLAGSTDVSNVSNIVPTAQFFACCMPVGVALHTWQSTACCGMSIGEKGMIYASKILADAAVKILQNPEIITKIK